MKLRKLLLWLSGTLLPSISLAADPVKTLSGYPEQNPLSHYLPTSDYSLGYLKQMFGDVGGMIHSDVTGSIGGFMMGDLFRIFNSAMLVFAVVVLIYIVFTSTLRMAHEGEAMGLGSKEWSSPWIIIRAAIAMVMLVPQAGGYCLAQKIVMYIVLMGVAGANMMWSTAVDKMISKDVITSMAKQQAISDVGSLLAPTEAIYEQQACRHGLYGKNGNGHVSIYGPFISYNHILPAVPYDTASIVVSKEWDSHYSCSQYSYDNNGDINGCLDWDKNRHVWNFLSPATLLEWGGEAAVRNITGNTNEEYQSGGMSMGLVPPDMKEAIEKPVCGGISWVVPYSKKVEEPGPSDDEPGDRYPLEIDTDMQATISASIYLMYAAMDYAADHYADKTTEEGNGRTYTCGSDPANNTEIAKTYGCFVQALNTYALLISEQQRHLNYRKDAQELDNVAGKPISGSDLTLETAVEKFRNRIKNEGWANAGSYFYNIAELSSIAGLDFSSVKLNIIPANYVVDKKNTKLVNEKQSGVNEYLQHSFQELNHYYAFNADASDGSEDTQEAKRRSIILRLRGSISYDFGDQQLNGNARVLFDVLTLGIAAMIENFDRHLIQTISLQAQSGAGSLVNPVISLQRLGRTQLEQVANIWVNGLISIDAITLGLAGVSAIPFVGNAAQTIAGGITSMISWLQGIMAPIALALYGSGFLLTNWLPFLPFILSLFCVFGWILAVVEMMVAAPIVALGILSPEGHAVFGKGSPAVLLSLAMFLRPILMILGFIAAIIGIFVASSIVNAGFMHMIHSVFHSHITMLSSVGLITMYTVVMVSLFNKSFGMMTAISNHVLRWIGGQSANFDQGETQMLEGAGSKVETAGGKAGEGLSTLQKGGMDKGTAGIMNKAGDAARKSGEEKIAGKKDINVKTDE